MDGGGPGSSWVWWRSATTGGRTRPGATSRSNALYADASTGEVFDYFGGLDDLAVRRVRFIGDPLQRIAEDHLRICASSVSTRGSAMRSIRRAGGVRRARERPDGVVARTDRQRIAAAAVAPHAVAAVATMVDRGILLAVLPGIDAAGVDRFAALAAREASAGIPPDPIRRLAVLVPPAEAEGVGARLKLSNADRKRLIAATAGRATRARARSHTGSVPWSRSTGC